MREGMMLGRRKLSGRMACPNSGLSYMKAECQNGSKQAVTQTMLRETIMRKPDLKQILDVLGRSRRQKG